MVGMRVTEAEHNDLTNGEQMCSGGVDAHCTCHYSQRFSKRE